MKGDSATGRPPNTAGNQVWRGHEPVLENVDTGLHAGLCRQYQWHAVPDTIIGYSRLNVDHLGVGEIGFERRGDAGSNPNWAHSRHGLTLSVTRPADAADDTPIGHWATFDLTRGMFQSRSGPFHGHGRFLLHCTFRRPSQHGTFREPDLVPPRKANDRTWAVSLLLKTTGKSRPEYGVTFQFKPEGIRLNTPGANVRQPYLPQDAADRITNLADPENLTLLLDYQRSRTPHSARAMLLISQEVIATASVDYLDFDDVYSIDKLMVGLGSVAGRGYTMQVDIVDVQIWTPLEPSHG